MNEGGEELCLCGRALGGLREGGWRMGSSRHEAAMEIGREVGVRT